MWWFIHMIVMVAKLVTSARNDGHCFAR